MDPAAVGGFFISAFLQVLFDRIASREIWDFFRARKLDQLLSNLGITLNAVNKLIQDAEDKQFDYLRVRQWLQKLQEAMYEAEDLLDAVNTEAMQLRLEEESSSQSKTSKLRRFFFSCNSQPARIRSKLKMETKLKEIVQRLEDLVKQKDLLGLREGVGQKPSQRQKTTSLIGETIVYGRDTDKEAIKELLLSDSMASDNNLDVITITGMGGLGKTALAQLVYNADIVKQNFSLRAWVCISEELDVLKVTRSILEAVGSSNLSSTNSLDGIQVELQQKLSENRFLLVLDDVWNENPYHWETLRKPLLHGAKGSKILVTTRNERVAEIMRAVQTHQLQKLSEEDGWLLFAKQAFKDGDSHSPALQEIGRKIVEKCGGLPLAVKVLGGLLRYKRTPEEWVKVLESNMWESKDAKSDILPVLRVSYQYLPSHLKLCFAYASIYPKDHAFQKEELIRLWMAQGFLLDPEGRKKMEEVGDEYFNELVSRSLFQHSTARWEPEYFVMHNLFNDLTNFVSGQSCFCMQRGSTLQEVPPTTRHLSYRRRRLIQFEDVPVANCLRTFLLLGPYSFSNSYMYEEVVPNNLLKALRLVRVLSFNGYSISEIPESIGNLKYLRYLDLSCTPIKRLPDSVCNLCNLQTLLLRCCYDLIELPENMWKLVNLHYLDIEKCDSLGEMPINIGRLKSLRTLRIFIVGNSSIKELGQLPELQGDLKIGQLQNVVWTTDAAEARLNDKKYLGCLYLEWSEKEHNDSRKEYDVLEKLQPHQNLKVLRITSYGGTRFPNWVGGPTYSNMLSVQLQNCRYCFSLPALGQLPSLKYLYIEGLSGLVCVDADFYGNCTTCAFGSLEELCFSNMCEWEEWCGCDVEKAFPLLGVLDIRYCPKLKGDLPFYLPSLKKLRVSECPALGGSLLPRAPLLEVLKLDCVLMVWDEPLQGLKSLEMWDCKDEASESLLEKVMLTSTCLETLRLITCSSLTSLPEMNSTCPLQSLSISNCSSLTSLPEMNSMCPLQSLGISECSSLMYLPEKIGLLSSLKSLEISTCEKLELPMEHQFASLEKLTISINDALRSFPLNLFPKLSDLNLWFCENLEFFSDSESLPSQGLLSQLTQLDILKCPNLLSFSAQGFPFPNLRHLSIEDCSSMKLLGEQQMQVLLSPDYHLSVLPSTLTSIEISKCDNLVLELLAFGLISGLPRLTHLTIGGPCEGVMSFPQEGCLPTSLNSLTIFDFSDLETLQYKGLHNLTSLSSLEIWSCCKLRCLPQEGLPTSLSSLNIARCPLLEQRLQREQGEDWDKIASIPEVVIDD